MRWIRTGNRRRTGASSFRPLRLGAAARPQLRGYPAAVSPLGRRNSHPRLHHRPRGRARDLCTLGRIHRAAAHRAGQGPGAMGHARYRAGWLRPLRRGRRLWGLHMGLTQGSSRRSSRASPLPICAARRTACSISSAALCCSPRARWRAGGGMPSGRHSRSTSAPRSPVVAGIGLARRGHLRACNAKRDLLAFFA